MKKGELLVDTPIGGILGILGAVILIFLLVQLAYPFLKDETKENSISYFKILESKLDYAKKNGESAIFYLGGEYPVYFVYFGEKSSCDIFLRKAGEKNTICVCSIKKNGASYCPRKACKDLEFPMEGVSLSKCSYLLDEENPFFIYFSKENKRYYIAETKDDLNYLKGES